MKSGESWEKDAIIMFDELDLKKVYEYDKLNKQVSRVYTRGGRGSIKLKVLSINY